MKELETLFAIKTVKKELSGINNLNSIEAKQTIARLVTLYACLDIDELILEVSKNDTN